MAETSPEKLIERLARGKTPGAVVLEGTDSYLLEMCRNAIVEAFVPEGARDWAVERLAARDAGWREILRRAQNMPMLAPRQVIIVQGAESLEKLGDKAREEILESLEKYLDSPAPFTVLVLEAAALDGRQRFSKLLHEKALVVELTIGSESAASLAQRMARELGAEIDREAAALLAEILNGEPARIRTEMEKLATYALGRGRITAADVGALVLAARKNTVWQFADMLASRNRPAAFAFLDNLLREGEQPAGIVGALARTYRRLIEARAMPPHTNAFQAARQLGMPPDAAERALRDARRIPMNELLAGLTALAEADSQLKSRNPDPRAAMEFLIARLTSSASRPASAGS
jgi:DNA polymerase III subunit delta